jgi:hypothetical protein
MAYWQNTQGWPSPEPFIRHGWTLTLYGEAAGVASALTAAAYSGIVFPSTAAPVEVSALTSTLTAASYPQVVVGSTAAPVEVSRITSALTAASYL